MEELQSNLAEREYELKALKYIARIQNVISDINDIQINILEYLQAIFKAEHVLLTIITKDNPNQVLMKHLAHNHKWASQNLVNLEKGVIWQSIFSKKVTEILSKKPNPIYDTQFEMIEGLTVRSLLCIPLLADRKTLGVVTLLNYAGAPMPPQRLDLLSCLTTALANALRNYDTLQELKRTNADLENNRWELMNSRNTLRALFDSIPASMYIVDPDYILVAINMSRADRAKLPPAKLVGNKCYQILFGENEPCMHCRALETLNTGNPTNRILRKWIDKDSFIEWEVTTYPIYNQEDHPIQVILVENDVTEKRYLEANLIQNEKLAAVGQLAAGVAHEINNPLAAIIANAQVLIREIPRENKDIHDSLQLIEIAGTRASQVVKNLLGFARKEEYDFARIDINETIHNALTLVQHEINSRPLVISLDLKENLPPAVASKDHLQGVWVNLIMNAIDAIDPEPGEITIHTDYRDKEYLISVTDNGKGIAADKLERIFEPFYTTKSAGHGTGLGLSVCNRIVKKHGGVISAESSLGKGTRFSVTLPSAPLSKVTGSLSG